MKRHATSPDTCQACGQSITGDIHRFSDDPASAFCSLDCQISKTTIEVHEVALRPITEPLPPRPVYHGPMAKHLHDDRGCDCDVRYQNEIVVPKWHSVICFCPRCGCVTQD
jgi:hypothetical protein